MRFASLGSGSEGNGLVIEAQAGESVSRVLLDCGFPVRETERRLARLGLRPDALDAILVTHEHSDHASGVFRLARRYGIPVWASHGTLRACNAMEMEGLKLNICSSHEAYSVGALEIHPYPVLHDASEPIQFVFTDGDRRLGVLTDTGRSTPHIVAMLDGCHGLVLECNHDRALLEGSSYPYSLKQRIAGAYGHLDNAAAAGILASMDRSRLQVLFAAHLSRQNNTPRLARAALAAVGYAPEDIGIADQDAGFDWVRI